MIVSFFVIAGMARLMVELMMDGILSIMMLNHIRIPKPGWEMEIVKFVIVLLIITPIFGVIMTYSRF